MSASLDDGFHLRFRTARWARVELAAPWGAEHPASRLPALFVVEQGSAVVSTKTDSAEVKAGDIVLLPRGDTYRFASDSHVATPPIDELARAYGLSCTGLVSLNGRGASTHAAGFSFDAPLETTDLLRFVPELLVLRGSAVDAWTPDVAKALGKVARERSAAATAAATKLGELVFSGAIRAALDDVGGAPLVLATVGLLRGSLGSPWTAGKLARRLGRSRAAFYDAFTRAAGVSPMAFLSMMRLREGDRLLRETDLSVELISESVGFASSSSFAAAFRQRFGESPSLRRARFRRRGS